MAVVFPDIEKTVVSYLKTALASTSFANAHVATKRAEPDETQPDYQVVVNVQYQNEVNFVLKNAMLMIDVFALDYSHASDLAFLIESKIRDIVGSPIKEATVTLGPVRRPDQRKQELRSLEVELLVKGSN